MPNTTENERWIKNRLSLLDIKQKDFMRALGIQEQHFKWLENKPRLSFSVIAKMAEILKCDTQKLLKFWNNEISENELWSDAVIDKQEDSVSIKIIDAVACCGTGIEALHENVVGTWDIPLQKYRDFATSKPENVYMLQVEGDSMSPTLNSGDWALADTSQNYISSDGLYLIRMASGLAVKRIQSGLNDITIKSDNPAYKDITASIGEVSIIGKIIYTLNAKKYG
jgi:SOS-response transcriptional repressor LexA